MPTARLTTIEQDTSIQCRSQIDIGVVNEYAERMTEGDVFPPVILFGDKKKSWIGDGWHRVMAATQIAAVDIPAELREGGRIDALKYALGANAVHGQRRSNADKKRSVEIAVREFPKLSNRAVADMCGVSHPFVEHVRPPQVETVTTSKRQGADGKQYPATRQTATPPRVIEELESAETLLEQIGDAYPAETKSTQRVPMPKTRIGLFLADVAIRKLEEIPTDDLERDEALNKIGRWLDEHRCS